MLCICVSPYRLWLANQLLISLVKDSMHFWYLVGVWLQTSFSKWSLHNGCPMDCGWLQARDSVCWAAFAGQASLEWLKRTHQKPGEAQASEFGPCGCQQPHWPLWCPEGVQPASRCEGWPHCYSGPAGPWMSGWDQHQTKCIQCLTNVTLFICTWQPVMWVSWKGSVCGRGQLP